MPTYIRTNFGGWLKEIDPNKDWNSIRSIKELEAEVVESIQRLGVVSVEHIFNFAQGVYNPEPPVEDIWWPKSVYIPKEEVSLQTRHLMDAPTQELALSPECTDSSKFNASRLALIRKYLSLPDQDLQNLVNEKADENGYIVFDMIDNELVVRNLQDE